MLVNTAGVQTIKDKHVIKNKRTKLVLTARQETIRRNKVLSRGRLDGKYVTGGSVEKGASYQRIAAWKRDAA